MLDQNVKISIIIPVYNMEDYLYDCLNSVVNQTLKDIEFICVDDGSTDSSLSILHEYAYNDSRVIILTQENQGAGVARNTGLDIATGEYIAFMDPDDFYNDTTTLFDLYQATIKSKCLIVGGSLAVFSNGKLITEFTDEKKEHVFTESKIISFYDYQCEYYYQKFIFNREFLLKHNIKFPYYRRFQDPPFLVLAMITAKEFYVINRITYVYRISHKQVNWDSARVNDMLHGIYDVLELSSNNNLYKLLNKTVQRVNCGVQSVYLSFINKDVIDADLLKIILKIHKKIALYNNITDDNLINNCRKQDINLAKNTPQKYIQKYEKGVVRKK